MKLFGEVPKHDAGKYLIAVKIAIMRAYFFHVLRKSKDVILTYQLQHSIVGVLKARVIILLMILFYFFC